MNVLRKYLTKENIGGCLAFSGLVLSGVTAGYYTYLCNPLPSTIVRMFAGQAAFLAADLFFIAAWAQEGRGYGRHYGKQLFAAIVCGLSIIFFTGFNISFIGCKIFM